MQNLENNYYKNKYLKYKNKYEYEKYKNKYEKVGGGLMYIY